MYCFRRATLLVRMSWRDLRKKTQKVCHWKFISRTPKQTLHFDTRSEIYPSRTLVKNEIMKTFKSAQNIGNRARKCIWLCFSCEMGYLITRLQSFTRLKARERFRRLVLR